MLWRWPLARVPGLLGRPARPLMAWPIANRRLPAGPVCNGMTGCWIPSIPTGVWTSAAWGPGGARGHWSPTRSQPDRTGGPCCPLLAMALCCIAPRNMARGSTKPRDALVCGPVAFSLVAVFPVPRTVHATGSALCKTPMPVLPIRTAGPTRGSRSSATRHAVVHDASSVRAGPVFASDPRALRGSSRRQGLTGDKLRNL
jgi:hypothetical protein